MSTETEIIPLNLIITSKVDDNNLAEYMAPARLWLSALNRAPSTDEEFGDAELNVKRLKDMEDMIRTKKDEAISKAEDVKRTLKAYDDATEELRSARLEIEKLIAYEKEKRKTEKAEKFLASFVEMGVDESLARKHYWSGFLTAMKGRRTLDSIETALRLYATTQQGLIAECRTLLDSFEQAHGTDLISDRRTLELEKPEGLEAELRRRFEAKRAADERKRLEDEAAKAKAELAAELAAKMNPHNLPPPPKIGSIQVGNPPPANVEPVNQAAPLELSNEISEAEEMRQFFATVKAAFAQIREHKMRLIHEGNVDDATRLGAVVNEWRGTIKAKMEVAP